MDQVQEKLLVLRNKLDQIPALQQAEEKTKVPKEYLVVGGGALLIILLFFGTGAGLLCSLVGFVYPAFQSLKCIEDKNKGDDIQWLVYWVIFSFFGILESFANFLIYWIPFYYAFKLAFLMWAFLPQTKGAKFLYDTFLKDFLKKENRIESAMADAKKSAESTAEELVSAANEALKKAE
ncbi:MAG: hypothetical protein SGBAC_002351 [Bacillariaceae sp.]